MHSDKSSKNPPYLYVDNADAWSQCLKALQRFKRLAIDLEADSLYVYREKVCLIQISTDEQDYIIDPLADFSLEALGGMLADPKIEKVFHASEYDLILLKREYDWDVHNLFDTMWAARILGYKNMGLAWFLNEFYDVTLSKKHQKANWAIRPLTEAQLDYAKNDTCYLLQLRDHFEQELRAAGRLEEALEIFANEAQVRVPDRKFDPESFWNIKGARDLPPRSLAILRELFLLREDEARDRDLPPFKVINNPVLLKLAEAAPRNMRDLRSFKGLPARAYHRMGDRILAAIETGRHAPIPKQKRQKRQKQPYNPEVSDRFERLAQWRKQCAQERGVESDVILTRQTMWEIAQSNPDSLQALAEIPSLGPKRIELLGQGILDEIARNDA